MAFTEQPLFTDDAASAAANSLQSDASDADFSPLKYSQLLSEETRTKGTVANFVSTLGDTATAIRSCFATGDFRRAYDLYDRAKDTVRQNREDISYLSGLSGYGADVDNLAKASNDALLLRFADEKAIEGQDYTIRDLCENRSAGMSLMKGDLTDKYGIDEDVASEYAETDDRYKRKALGICFRELKSPSSQPRTSASLGSMKSFSRTVSERWDDASDGTPGLVTAFGDIGAVAFVGAMKDLKQSSPVGAKVMDALITIGAADASSESGATKARRIVSDYDALSKRVFKSDAVERDPVTGRPIEKKLTDDQKLVFDGILCALAKRCEREEGLSLDLGDEAAYRAIVGVTDAMAKADADGISLHKMYHNAHQSFTKDAADFAVEQYIAYKQGVPAVGRSMLAILKDSESSLKSMVRGSRSSRQIAYDITGDQKAYTNNMFRKSGVASDDPLPACTAMAAAFNAGIVDDLFPKALHSRQDPMTLLRRTLGDGGKDQFSVIDACARHLSETSFAGMSLGKDVSNFVARAAILRIKKGQPVVFDQLIKEELSGAVGSLSRTAMAKNQTKFAPILTALKDWSVANIDEAAFFSKEYQKVYNHVKNWTDLSDAQAQAAASSTVAQLQSIRRSSTDPVTADRNMRKLVKDRTSYIDWAEEDKRAGAVGGIPAYTIRTSRLGGTDPVPEDIRSDADLEDPVIINKYKRLRDLAAARSKAIQSAAATQSVKKATSDYDDD